MRFPRLRAGEPALILAPMEGVTDAPMRALLTERGGFTFCVAEFLRVGPDKIPDWCFFQHIPELASGARTEAGTPVAVQILGGDEGRMAESAAQAVELGAPAIDINFGCPSKTVNRHDGGATLLKYPERIRSITRAVRAAVPPEVTVSVKMRLGWEDRADIRRNSEEAAEGGADWLTIHARTKKQGYAPPVDWTYIGEVRAKLSIPVVANGDIWTIEDFEKCREITGCEHFMIGRGALADPKLPLEIARRLGISTANATATTTALSRAEWEALLRRFVDLNLPVTRKGPEVIVGRMKQWLKFAHVRRPIPWFDDVKRAETIESVFETLSRVN